MKCPLCRTPIRWPRDRVELNGWVRCMNDGCPVAIVQEETDNVVFRAELAPRLNESSANWMLCGPKEVAS